MNIEDIKIGETYYVRVRVARIDTNRFVCQPLNQDGTPSDFVPNYFNFAEAEAFYPAENVTKSAKNAQKYDPCREFRAGDKVELKTNLGRNPYDTFDGQEYIPDGTVFTVLRDEWAGGKVDIFEKDESDAFTVHFSNLELVTPVEELEPYFIEETEYEYCVSIMVGERKDTPATYHKRMHPHAKEAANAERDRLNAEYRKEQE